MTPAHCNCLYFNERKRTCHNPDSDFYHGKYHEELPFVGDCPAWEHWREFKDMYGKRLTKLGGRP